MSSLLTIKIVLLFYGCNKPTYHHLHHDSGPTGLLTLKQRWPGGFKDVCLYSEICQILASYNYRLTARRFIQELFMDLVFTEVSQLDLKVLYLLVK